MVEENATEWSVDCRFTAGHGWLRRFLAMAACLLAATAVVAREPTSLIVSAPEGIRELLGDGKIAGTGVASWLPNGAGLIYARESDNTLHVTGWPTEEESSRMLAVPSSRSQLTAAWQWSASPSGRWLFVERSELRSYWRPHGLPDELEEEARSLRWRGFIDLRDGATTPFREGRAIGWLGERCLITLGDGGPLLAVNPTSPGASIWLADELRYPAAVSRDGSHLLAFAGRNRYELMTLDVTGIRTVRAYRPVREGEDLCGVGADFSDDGRWLALRRDHCDQTDRNSHSVVFEVRSVAHDAVSYRDEFQWRENTLWIPPTFAPDPEITSNETVKTKTRLAYGRSSGDGETNEIVVVTMSGGKQTVAVIPFDGPPRSAMDFPALWSPEGDRFGWTTEDSHGYIVDVDTLQVHGPVVLPRRGQEGIHAAQEFWTWGEPTWRDLNVNEQASYSTFWKADRDRAADAALLDTLASSPCHAAGAEECRRDPSACVQLGLSLWRGDDGFADQKGARQVLRMACHAHIADSCYELANVLRSKALSQSLASIHWLYRKACFMGHENACEEAVSYERAGSSQVSEFWPRRFEAIAIGGLMNQMCGLAPDGDAHCWEIGGPGRSFVPGKLVEISGGGFVCGRRQNGMVVCWGNAGSTRRGDHGQFAPPRDHFRKITVGGRHACGILLDGSVVCWGADDFGQATAPAGQFLELSAGQEHTCGVRTDSQLVCWGAGSGPQQIPGTFHRGQSRPPAGGFGSVSSGSTNTCGIRVEGQVECWGSDTDWKGEVPLSIAPPPGGFSAVELGSRHACGLHDDGMIACWGAHDRGESQAPDDRFAAIDAHAHTSCGLRADGAVVCWGGGRPGTLTYPPSTSGD